MFYTHIPVDLKAGGRIRKEGQPSLKGPCFLESEEGGQGLIRRGEASGMHGWCGPEGGGPVFAHQTSIFMGTHVFLMQMRGEGLVRES